MLLFSRSALNDLALASFSCSHHFLLIPCLCSHCWDFLVFLRCLWVKPVPAYFLPFCLCLPLLLLLSPSLLPVLFSQDSLILLCLIYYFSILKYSPDPRSAAPWPRCPLFSQLAFRSSCFTQQQITPAWWEAAAVSQLEEPNRSCCLSWKQPVGCISALQGATGLPMGRFMPGTALSRWLISMGAIGRHPCMQRQATA